MKHIERHGDFHYEIYSAIYRTLEDTAHRDE